MTTLFAALALTIVVETAISALILRRVYWLEAFAIQCATWPVAQWLLWRTGAFWAIEIGVTIVEIALWRIVIDVSWRRAAMVSLCANGVTVGLAVLLAG